MSKILEIRIRKYRIDTRTRREFSFRFSLKQLVTRGFFVSPDIMKTSVVNLAPDTYHFFMTNSYIRYRIIH